MTFSNLLLLVIINIFILHLIGKPHFFKMDEFSIIIIIAIIIIIIVIIITIIIIIIIMIRLDMKGSINLECVCAAFPPSKTLTSAAIIEFLIFPVQVGKSPGGKKPSGILGRQWEILM